MSAIRHLAVISAALVLGGCGSSTNAPATVTAPPSTVTVQATPTTATSMTAQPPAPTVAAGPWTMPDLIGQDLQAAQDAVQSLTDNKVFFSGSKDLTGQGRMQINDRNWQVCTSTPPAGSPITEQTSVEFGVVKESESCP